jgi:FkbM family methyltransferase
MDKREKMPLGTRLLRSIARRLPESLRQVAAKYYFYRQIRAGNFKSVEVEWERLGEWIGSGDCCIDVGANVGRYTLKMSDLVGQQGHVIAFEPLTRSFDLLTHFVKKSGRRNVTLLNAAATSTCSFIDITPHVSSPKGDYIFDTNTGTQILTAANDRTTEGKLGLSIDALNSPSSPASEDRC